MGYLRSALLIFVLVVPLLLMGMDWADEREYEPMSPVQARLAGAIVDQVFQTPIERVTRVLGHIVDPDIYRRVPAAEFDVEWFHPLSVLLRFGRLILTQPGMQCADLIEPGVWLSFKIENEPALTGVAAQDKQYDPRAEEIRNRRIRQVLSRRLDGLGVRVLDLVVKHGAAEVVIPRLSKAQHQQVLRELISQTRLEFRLVDDKCQTLNSGLDQYLEEYRKLSPDVADFSFEPGYQGRLELKSATGKSLTDLIAWLLSNGALKTGSRLAVGEAINYTGERKTKEFTLYCLEPEIWITNHDIADASVQQNQWDMGWQVGLTFTAEAGERFAELTGQSVQRKLAILLDDTVQSAPVIQERIPGGRAVISLGYGNNGQAAQLLEAQHLVVLLKAGHYNANLEFVREVPWDGSSGPWMKARKLLCRIPALPFPWLPISPWISRLPVWNFAGR